MTYDIDTIFALVNALGGPAELSRRHGITAHNIEDWTVSGHLPPAWHFRLYLELLARNLTANPDLFEMTDEQAAIAWRTNGCAVKR